MEGSTLHISELENLPNETLYEILSKLSAQDVVQICSASKKIRQKCSGVWYDLFKRDISKYKVCSHPNWEKLYRLAATRNIPVYLVSIYDEDEEEVADDYALGEIDLPYVLTKLLEEEGEDPKTFFEEHHTIKVGDDYDAEDHVVSVDIVGYVSMEDVFRANPKSAHYLYEMRVRFGRTQLSYFAMGFGGLLKMVGKVLDDMNFDEYTIEDAIYDIKDAKEEGTLEEKVYDIVGDRQSAEARIKGVKTIDITLLKKLRESACQMK